MTTFIPTTALSTQGARSLEQADYVDAEVFRREQEVVFGQRWLCVGREEQVQVPGQFLRVDIGPESLLVVRDRQGTLRAHHNTCRHRGARLCEATHGELSETIQCPYHAWTYALDGRLIGVPDQKEMEGFDKADYPLLQAEAAAWEGFVFVNLADRPEPFAEAFAPLLGRFAAWNLPGLRVGRRLEYDVRANWKLLFENYSECYHCSPVHPSLVKLTPPTSGENDLTDGPVLGGFMTVTELGGSLSRSGRACGVPVAPLSDADMQRVYYYSIFPNMLLSLHPDYVMVHRFRPLAPDRTQVWCDFLFHPETLQRSDLDPDDGVLFWDTVNREDWHLCEQTQLGVQGKAYRPGPYSRRESLCAAFDRHYRLVMQAAG
jgi:Rieske 2Fe-2S family protein